MRRGNKRREERMGEMERERREEDETKCKRRRGERRSERMGLKEKERKKKQIYRRKKGKKCSRSFHHQSICKWTSP